MNSRGHTLPEPDVVETRVSLRTLSEVGGRPTFIDYLVRLWDYRHFVFFDARARVMHSHVQDRLGSLWLILNPLLSGATYYFVFGVMLGTGKGIENFVAYLLIGVYLFNFSTRTINAASRSISGNLRILRAFPFPRAVLPLASNLREAMSMVPGMLVVLLLIVAFPPAEVISEKWLLLVPILVLQTTFHLGVSLILARIVSFARDVTHLVAFAMRVWLYISAVFFSPDRFADHPIIKTILEINPMFRVLDMARDCLIYNRLPATQSWLILALWSLVTLIMGLVFFWRGEESYGRD
ncbi:teichoic acid transport system permease protein [Arthrobacter cupressi]|uniref:Transport permease protein n=1 Tax=Arthrobacter cupressi TaxID=1045773 RepID=A0A1G8UKU1_9MICC|nr:teichoic acid transport system permease protein [Arthrobacter cupressi]